MIEVTLMVFYILLIQGATVLTILKIALSLFLLCVEACFAACKERFVICM